MEIRQIKCDVCNNAIGYNDERYKYTKKVVVNGQGDIISSDEPTYITINLKGHGVRCKLNREYDICEECLWNGIVIDQIDKHLRIYSRKEIPRNER